MVPSLSMNLRKYPSDDPLILRARGKNVLLSDAEAQLKRDNFLSHINELSLAAIALPSRKRLSGRICQLLNVKFV